MALKPIGARLILENERGFIRGMKKAGSSVAAFEGTTQKASVGAIAMGTALGNLATGGLALVGRGIVKVGQLGAGFLGNSIIQAQGLEAQMSGVAAVLGTTEDELTQLNALVKDLGLDPNLKVSSLEAAAAIEVLAKNGLNVSQIMDGAARSTVALANATGADMTVAADVATDAMSQFGITAANMGTAIDGITGVVTNSKFDINDYALAIATSGKIAAETGIGFADFNTVLAASASAFSSGSDAGTSFKTTIQRLSNPTDEVRETMDRLGISLFDSEGKTRGMSEVVGQLNTAFSGMTNAQKANTAAVLGGADASRTILSLAGLTREEFEALSAEVNRAGQAQESAAKRVDNLAGAMDILSGVIEAIQLSIGQAFLPMLTKMATLMSGFLEENSARFITFFETAAKGISVFAESLLNGEGPVKAFAAALAAVGVDEGLILRFQDLIKVVSDLITPIAAFVQDHAEAFKRALITIGAILAGAGIVAGVLALGAAVAALVNPITLIVAAVGLLGLAWAKNWGGIQDKTMAAINFIRPFIEKGIAAIRKVFDDNWTTIQAVVLTAWKVIQAAITSAINIIKPAIDTFVKNFQGSFEQFKPLIAEFKKLWVVLGPVVEAILLAMGAAFLALVGIAAGMVRGISQAIGPLVGTITRVVGGIVQAFTGLLEFITGFVELVIGLFRGNSEAVQEAWRKMGTGLLDIVQGFIKAIVGGITGFVKTMFALISGLVTGIIDFFKGLSEALIDGSIIPDMIRAILKAMGQFALDFVSGLKDMMVSAVEAIKAGVTLFIEAGGAIVTAMVAGIKEKANALPEAIGAAIREAAVVTVTLFQQIQETVALIWSQLVEGVIEKTRDLAEGVGGFLERLAQDGAQSIGDMARLIVDAVANMARKFVSAIQDMLKGALDKLSDAVDDFKNMGSEMMAGMIGGIKDKAKDLANAAKSVVDKAVNKAKQVLGIGSPSKVFIAIGQDIIEGLIIGVKSTGNDFGRVLSDILEKGKEISSSFSFSKILKERVDDLTTTLKAAGKEIQKTQKGIDKLEAKGIIDLSLEELNQLTKLNALRRQQQDFFDRTLEKRKPLAAPLTLFETEAITQDFLANQLKFLKSLRDQGIETSEILEGLTFGVNAPVEDFVEAQGRLLQELNKKAALELEVELKFGDFFGELNKIRQPLDDLLDPVSVSGIASPFAKLFQTGFLDEQRRRLERNAEMFQGVQDRLIKTNPNSNLVDFYKTFLEINNEERVRISREIVDNQERLFKIQEKQSKLDFLGEQQKLLDLIAKNKLNPATILKGITLGINASAEKLLTATETALTAIIEKTNTALQTVTPGLIFGTQQKQDQLKFLEDQQKLLDLIDKNKLDKTSILDGMILGLNAGVNDLSAAMDRALSAIITKTNEELQIASPSRVFMKIGQNVIAGLQAGIAGAQGRSIPATAGQITNQAINQISNRTINVEYTNNSGLPLSDAGELDFILASYA